MAYQKLAELSADKKNLTYVMCRALLEYNLYGKQNAYQYLDSLKAGNYSDEYLLYTKTWLGKVTENPDDYDSLLESFKSKYPNSLLLTRFAVREYYYKKSEFERDKDKVEAQLEKKLDAILAQPGLSTSDKVYFSLVKCDILSEDSWRKYNIIGILENLWSQYPDLLEKEYLLHSIADCKDERCLQLAQKINTALGKNNTKDNINGLIEILNDFNNTEDAEDDPELIKELETKLRPIITNEKDSLKKEILKSTIKFTTIDSDVSDYRTMSLFNLTDIEYSIPFKSLLKCSLSKNTMEKLLLDLLDQYKGIQGKRLGYDNEELEKIKDEMLTMTKEDISFVIGAIEYYTNYGESISSISKYMFDASQESAEEKDIENWDNFAIFLDKNPLYSGSMYSYDYPDVNTEADLLKGIDVYNQAIKKYPGLVGLKETKLKLIDLNEDHISANRKKIFTEIFNTVVDLFESNQSKGTDYDDIEDYFSIADPARGKYSKQYTSDDDILKYMLQVVGIKEQQAILKRITDKLALHPGQKNLIDLKEAIEDAGIH